MAIIARKYNFVGGTTVDPLQVNAELDQLIAAHNDQDTRLSSNYYTKVNLQTSGEAQMHWDNLIGKPNFADSSWKPSVATRAALPLTDNTIGDQRVVLNDGDSKQAVYTCIATAGTIDQQWAKVGDVDWMAGEATREAQETARVTAEANRVTAESGRVTAESARVSSESGRASAETARVNAENSRVTAENNRVSAESSRVTAENGRVTAESGRVTAENGRVAADSNRVHRGAYNSVTAYSVGNEVSYQGSTYRCILASTGNAPTNATYWVMVASAGDMVKSVYDSTGKNEDIFAYVDTHKNNTLNPHGVTAAQVGAMTDLVNDTTPQLGGALDRNGKPIYGDVYDNGNSGTAKTINWNNGNYQKVTLNENCVFTFVAPTKACALALIITNEGIGRTITLPPYYAADGVAIDYNTEQGAINILTMIYDGTRYHCQSMANSKAVV